MSSICIQFFRAWILKEKLQLDFFKCSKININRYQILFHKYGYIILTDPKKTKWNSYYGPSFASTDDIFWSVAQASCLARPIGSQNDGLA